MDKLDGAQGPPLPRHLPRPVRRASALDALLSDSIESGPQNVHRRGCASGSPSCAATTRCRGCRRWPATSSATPPRTDRFLWDHRRTHRRPARRRVLRHARGRGARPRADATTPRRWRTTARSSATTWPCAATPTCRWARCGCSTPARGSRRRPTSPTSRARRRSRTCYGKPFTGAESMTAFHRPWSYTPRRLKHVADLELALGVTRFCIHTSPHQPVAACRRPGIGAGAVPRARRSSAPSRGRSWPGRGSTTWPAARGCSTRARPRSTWRCSSARRRRSPRCSASEPDRTVPAGFDFDYVDLDALERPVRRRGRRRWWPGRRATGCCTSAARARG